MDNKLAGLTVYSLKGNTLGILSGLSGNNFDACKITKTNKDRVLGIWSKHSTLLIGTPSYLSRAAEGPEYPKHLNHLERELESLHGKDIILFGSGRSEYPFFCGSLDYLDSMLSKKNNVIHVYKFEGYPKDKQKKEFKQIVEEIIYGNYQI